MWILFLCTLCFVGGSRQQTFRNDVAKQSVVALHRGHLTSKVSHLRSISNTRLQLSMSGSAQEVEPPMIFKDYAILAIVPIVWGSYSPLVKGLYSAAEVVAPPPLIFNLMSYFVSSAALTLANYISSKSNKEKADAAILVASTMSTVGSGINSKAYSLEWRAGVELGLWLFLGSTVQISGIQLTTAIRAAILVQLTTILVPIFETLLVNKKAITTKLWISCIIAMLGVITVSTDGGSINNLCGTFSWSCIDKSFIMFLENVKFNTGDLLVSLSAVFYSMHVIRLGKFASRVSPVKLAQIKSLTELTFSAAAISLVCLLGGNDMNSLSKFASYIDVLRTSFTESGQVYVLLAVLWNGAFATALTTWAQTVGQRSVSPTTANLLYSSQPIWAALISFSFLSESLSSSTVVGSSFLLFAVLYSLYTPPQTPPTRTTDII